ncbi:MAG: YdcF family protein [Candidatus Omnitrophica bacterium]|nr:YdcF family protein [Candidatus Omnitrophota bacterium]
MNGAPHGRVRLWVVATLLAGVLAGAWAFPRAGSFLVVEDRFSHADIALVLSGDAVHRSLAARDLYRQGRVDRILVIPEPPDPARDELVRLGLLDPAFVWSERILMASGVPRSKITFLPEPADGTIQEAMRVRAFLKDEPLASLVLITSKFASRRARFIFRRVLHRQVGTVFCSPSPYDAFNPVRWWAHPRQALSVVMEYQKLIANALILVLGKAIEEDHA